MTSDPLLPESVLRRSLRLDADEVPPPLDPVLIAAASRASRVPPGRILVAAAVAFAGGWLWAGAFQAITAGLFGTGALDPLGAIIALATSTLIGAAPVVEIATAPAVPIAILAAALLAALSERRRSHVPAS